MSGRGALPARLARRLLRTLLRLAGAGQAGLAARASFRLAFRGLARALGGTVRFRDPAQPASRLEAAPFAAALRHWGLAEEDLPKALAFWRLEALAGFGLGAFALAALAAGLWTGQGSGQAPGPAAGASQSLSWDLSWDMASGMAGLAARHLAHLAKASMALAGLALGLAACWRRAVIRGRRFVPFAEWLCFWR